MIGMGIYSGALEGNRDGVQLRKQPGKWSEQPGSRMGLVDGTIKEEGRLARPPSRDLTEGSLVTLIKKSRMATWLSRILAETEQCGDEHRHLGVRLPEKA